MKNSISITAIAAISLAAGLVACNSGNSAPQANRAQSAQGQAWAFTYKADCSQTADPTQCLGAYGFTVNADGTYQIGPAPQGQLLKEKLDASDFSDLSKLVSGIVDGSAAANAQETCSGYYTSESDYTLSFTKSGASSTVLHKTGTNLCSNRLDDADAEALDSEI